MKTQKIYSSTLSNTFNRYTNNNGIKLLRDKDGHSFGWKYNNIDSFKNVFYISGCSWTNENFCKRVLLNHYPNSVILNRSIGGQGNSMIIDLLEKDLDLLSNTNLKVFYLICFTEVGRNIKDFSYVNPKNYTSSHNYFADILCEQYKKTQKILSRQKHYITTSFVNNCFNKNFKIIDYCGQNSNHKPVTPVYNYSTGVYNWMKKNKIYNFNFSKDLEIVNKNIDWMKGFTLIDNTLHPNSYKPYEDFFSNINV